MVAEISYCSNAICPSLFYVISGANHNATISGGEQLRAKLPKECNKHQAHIKSPQVLSG